MTMMQIKQDTILPKRYEMTGSLPGERPLPFGLLVWLDVINQMFSLLLLELIVKCNIVAHSATAKATTILLQSVIG